MHHDLASREVFWNISYNYIIYFLLVVVSTIFFIGIYRRVRLWRRGRPENRFDHMGKRLLAVLKYGVAHHKILKESYPGIMHAAIFVGFVLLLIGTTTVSFDYDVWGLLFGQQSFLRGPFYLYFSFALELAGLSALIGIIMALYRRYIRRPDGLTNKHDDLIFLAGLGIIILTGFLIEGSRLAATQPEWARWSFVGYGVSLILSGLAPDNVLLLHRILWWSHLSLAFGFIAYIPFSKLFHMITSPLNIFFLSFKPKGEITSIDIEHSETFGVSHIDNFTWKHLLDLDACTRCGRCQDQCPAYLSGKPLSPKKLILDLLDELNRTAKCSSSNAVTNDALNHTLVGSVVTHDELWACTTCRACMEACPVLIEHIDKIIDLRRDRVLMDSDFPRELQATFRGMETNYNPWNIGHVKRADWVQDLNIKKATENDTFEYLWFVGCAASFDDRAQKVSRYFAKILNAAKVDYAILGAEEKCCGETARRLGNEYLAQMLMEMNISTFNELHVKKIITTCPHCYNTLKNEYPAFNGVYEVYHSTEFIYKLLKENKLSLNRINLSSKMAFHDSCYLGRVNDIYEQPREIINRIHLHQLIEPGEKHHEKSFCCGAGGGRMWLDETIGERINHVRLDQFAAMDVQQLVTACPYCLIMFDDAIKDKGIEHKMNTVDLIEMVAMSLNLKCTDEEADDLVVEGKGEKDLFSVDITS
ncbi:4Fe-4S dicluster domain-containing protein [candidate division KSB1 bacterium]|nr:4Fe-4S dicluster domain-containing protein [candidate division KSB1 bacterium]